MRDIGRLHLVTGADEDLLDIVDAALAGGVDTVQVRVDRRTGDRQAYQLTTLVLARCRASGATCLVDDRVDVAAAAGAHGCHLGAEDLPVALARAVLGPRAVIGATARTPESARQAVREGASYLGVGPVHATSTKTALPVPLGLAGLRAVVEAVSAPVVAIGGITPARAAAAALARAVGRGPAAEEPPPVGVPGITVNGVRRPVDLPATVEVLLREVLGVPACGIAVAVNGCVVPPTRWAGHQVDDGDEIEVLTALQGG